MNKRQLIYNCASEAVMRARVKIYQMKTPAGFKDEIDLILSSAMCDAGNFALKAVDADARRVKQIEQILPEPQK